MLYVALNQIESRTQVSQSRKNALDVSFLWFLFSLAGKMVEDYWGPSMKMLNDMKFLDNLKAFDKDNIPGPIMKRIRERYMSVS